MIHEVDEALRELVRSRALPGNEVEVAFEAPTKDWAARRNAPTVNIYLYDIREDMRKRSRGMINAYDDLGKIESRHMPPRHIKLSYLLTAWTQRPEDEHRLLSALLTSLLSYEEMPRELLTGSLAQIGRPVAVTVALPPPEDRSFADVWTALGGELKPSLDVVISAPVMAGRSSRPPRPRPPVCRSSAPTPRPASPTTRCATWWNTPPRRRSRRPPAAPSPAPWSGPAAAVVVRPAQARPAAVGTAAVRAAVVPLGMATPVRPTALVGLVDSVGWAGRCRCAYGQWPSGRDSRGARRAQLWRARPRWRTHTADRDPTADADRSNGGEPGRWHLQGRHLKGSASKDSTSKDGTSRDKGTEKK
ncbi:DUF4255 domain-containing protein [Fodinicola feengrottensis]|uniref:DUF4255 domain-containing protein n=1 Tax=Fodinicola feengrottensis TaxID=435914 RepID=UPI0024411656|nr:DUF4255 domain-containing protein [Fodinicola feengrottensis]